MHGTTPSQLIRQEVSSVHLCITQYITYTYSVNLSITLYTLVCSQVSILRVMLHPYIIGLVGVCLKPTPMLILEYAELSSLRSLSPYTNLGHSLKHRIAIQVSDCG